VDFIRTEAGAWCERHGGRLSQGDCMRRHPPQAHTLAMFLLRASAEDPHGCR
jgi:hypothetical protein